MTFRESSNERSSLAAAWNKLERAQRRSGIYDTTLTPENAGMFEPDFDSTPLLPEAYVRFVADAGYPWLVTDESVLAFLPPRWMIRESKAMGLPDRKWQDVKEERRVGKHEYRFVMFAAYDLGDCNGYAFGKDEHGDVVVWNVEDSVPRNVLGTFEKWLQETIDEMGEFTPKDPLGLLSNSVDPSDDD